MIPFTDLKIGELYQTDLKGSEMTCWMKSSEDFYNKDTWGSLVLDHKKQIPVPNGSILLLLGINPHQGQLLFLVEETVCVFVWGSTRDIGVLNPLIS